MTRIKEREKKWTIITVYVDNVNIISLQTNKNYYNKSVANIFVQVLVVIFINAFFLHSC